MTSPPQKPVSVYVKIGESSFEIKGYHDKEQMLLAANQVKAHVEKVMSEETTAKQTWETIGFITAIARTYELMEKNRMVAELNRKIEGWEKLFSEAGKELRQIEADARKALVDKGRKR